MSNMPAPVRPCHTAQHSVFRSRPLDTTVVGHSLRFALEYEGLGGAWLPVAWRQLPETSMAIAEMSSCAQYPKKEVRKVRRNQ